MTRSLPLGKPESCHFSWHVRQQLFHLIQCITLPRGVKLFPVYFEENVAHCVFSPL